MSYSYYMKYPIQQYYYGQIKKTGSIENDVDNFWLNLLPDYFQKKLNYGIEHEARPLPGTSEKRVDWTIRYIRNGDPKVILMEDKRRGLESRAIHWKAALGQLTTYMNLVRQEPNYHKQQTLYGALNIGTYTRFYQLDPLAQECIDYPGTDGKYYELADNEAEIHMILLELVQKTSHSSATSLESKRDLGESSSST